MVERKLGLVCGICSVLNALLLATELRRSVTPWEALHFGDHLIATMWVLALVLPLIAAWKVSRYWLICLLAPVALYYYGMSTMV